ncbi:MAG: hypothetical protein A2Z78_00315 [Candidatus Nealsonbacteria bacterium RBG_13_36_15]|uniref:Uncharacterized protein n=1 Tax=Candidatus Nealsonbacteria bacterium RBG_13_36_15 TaxID=1801660 RepID=A0A1G2DWB4_9BACT|nr:MAG: hypothetical protein A2Z78_00315 [Candidatus Nealsonbacteria bacterium RBG_13_36_15]
MSATTDKIKGASYLLEGQKERLIAEIGEDEEINDEKMEVIDEIFRQLLGVPIDNLTPSERNEIDRIIREFRN